MNEYLSIGKALWRYNLRYYFFPSLSFPCIQVWINFLLFCSFMKSVFYRATFFKLLTRVIILAFSEKFCR